MTSSLVGPDRPVDGLTWEETRRVLGVAMACDGRQDPGNVTIGEWQHASRIARWTYDEAVQAVRDHYARTPVFCMAAHVTIGIRAQREHRRHPPQWRARSVTPAASDDVRGGAMASIRRVFAEQRRRRQEALDAAEREESGDA